MNLSRQDAVVTLSGQTLTIERLSLPGRLSFDLTIGCMRRTRAAILAWLPISCRYLWVPHDVYVKVLPYMPPGIRINRCKAMEDPKTHLNSVLDHRRDDCSVCLKSLAIENVTVFSCGHAYHHDCIHRWVCIEKKKSCPYCRAYISRRMCCKCHPPNFESHIKEAVAQGPFDNMDLTREDAVVTLSGRTMTLERLSVPGRLTFDLESRRKTRAAIMTWLPPICKRIWIPKDIYFRVLPHIPPKLQVNRCSSTDDPKRYFNSIIDRHLDECQVCEKSLTTGEVTSYYCGHAFHDRCIHLWVCVSDRPCCPTCRARITKDMCSECNSI